MERSLRRDREAMGHRHRRAGLLAAVVGALLLAGCAPMGSADGQTTMRLSLNQAENHPSFIALENWSSHQAEQSDEVSIEVFPNETLGAQAEALQLVSTGIADMAIVSGTQLENLNEDFLVFNMPRVFDDVEHQMQVIHDPQITGELYASLEESNNITVLGGLTQGARSVYSTEGPVHTPQDLDGDKIRVQESELNVAMAGALGGAGTPMAFGELYTGLQSGVVDAAENNEVSYYTQGHYEVAPYWSYTNHLVGLDYLIINTEVLNSLSDSERALFDEGWAAAHTEHAELWGELTQEAIAGAEAGGATFNEVDEAAFDETLGGLAEDFITTPTQQGAL